MSADRQQELKDYRQGDVIGLRLVVAWLIDQDGRTEAFKDRFVGSSFDALLQKLPSGSSIALQNGFRDSIEQTLAWLIILGHEKPPA